MFFHIGLRLGLLAVLGLLPCAAVAAEPATPNYGFERVSEHGGVLDWKGSTTYPVGRVELVGPDPRHVRSGEHAVVVQSDVPSLDSPKAGHFYSQSAVPIDRASGPYRLTVWRRGTGEVGGALYLYRKTEAGESFHSSIHMRPAEDAAPAAEPAEWSPVTFVANAEDIPADAATARVVLRVAGEVTLDDVAFGPASAPVAAGSSPQESGVRSNLITVGVATPAPNADGTLADGEYAVTGTGLLEQQSQGLYPYANRFAMSQDAERFYFALELALPPGYDLQEGAAVADDASMIASRDTLFLMMRPDSDTSAKGFEGYYLAVNPRGVVYDAWEHVEWAKGYVNRDAGHDGDVRVASKTSDGRWVVELSVNRAAVAREGGDLTEMALSFGVNVAGYRPAWQLHANWFDHPQAFGVVKLASECVTVSVPEIGPLVQGRVEPRVVAANGTSEPAEVESQIIVATPRMIAGQIGTYIFDVAMDTRVAEAVADQVVERWVDRATVASGERQEFAHEAKLSEPQAQVMEIDVRAGGRSVYYQKIPFRYQPALTIELTPRPAAGQVEAEVALRGTPEEQRGRLRLALVNAAKEEAWSAEPPIEADVVSAVVPIESLPAGTYELRAELRNAQGDVVGNTTEPFVKPETPDWLVNRKGIEALEPDWVPEPWTPIEATSDKVAMWGRRFTFGEGSLMQQIESQDRPVLRAPITMHYRGKGGEHDFNVQPAQQKQVDRGVAVYEQSGGAEGMDLAVRHQIEFDGMDRIDLTITPKHAIDVEGMWIDIPFTDLSYALSTSLDDYWQHGVVSEAIFEKPRAWTMIWLGDEELGCGFFTQNYRGWHVTSAKPRITLHSDESGHVLRLHLVNTPTRVAEPMRITFGLHPTPTKPLFEGWRGLRPQGLGISPPPTNLAMMHSDYWGASDYNPWPRNWEAFKDAVETVHAQGQKMYPYLTGFSVSPYYKISKEYGFHDSEEPLPAQYYLQKKTEDNRNETYFYYAEDWQLSPPRLYSTPVETREEARVSPSSSWPDYFIGGVYELLNRTAMDGVYMDIHRPSLNYDADKGLDHVTVDGVREGSIELFATRDFYKRLYYVFDEARGDDSHPWIMGHGFGVSLPYASFWDINFNGEEIKPTVPFEFTRLALQSVMEGTPLAQVDPDVEPNYDAPGYRSAFSIGSGSVNMILPQYGYKPELKTRETARETLSVTFLHNDLLWPAYLASEVIYEFWREVEVPYGLADTTFHSYWDNGATTNAPPIKVSYWTKPGGKDFLVAVANWSGEPSVAEVALPSEFTAFTRATEMQTKELVSLSDGKFQIDVPAHDLRVLRITAE